MDCYQYSVVNTFPASSNLRLKLRINSVFQNVNLVFRKATLENKRNFGEVKKINQKEYSWNNFSRNKNAPGSNRMYLAHVSEEIKGRASEQEIFHKILRTENRILGAVSKLDEYLLIWQVWVHYGTVPSTSRYTDR